MDGTGAGRAGLGPKPVRRRRLKKTGLWVSPGGKTQVGLRDVMLPSPLNSSISGGGIGPELFGVYRPNMHIHGDMHLRPVQLKLNTRVRDFDLLNEVAVGWGVRRLRVRRLPASGVRAPDGDRQQQLGSSCARDQRLQQL